MHRARSKTDDGKHFLLLCKISALIGLAIGLTWAALFAATQHWHQAASLALLGLSVVPCWLIARRGHFSLGLQLTQLACMIFVIAFSLVFDTPTETVPRTTHLFLLVIALVGYMNLQRGPSLSQCALIAVCMAAFVVLAATTPIYPFPEPVQDELHAARAWVNALLVASLLCGGILAMSAEFTKTQASRELGAALWGDQFALFYQPQVDAQGRLVGAEALLRWNHPKRGQIPPAEFIPMAEASGFMPRLGNWVMQEACRTLSAWRDKPEMREVVLAINVSAAQFLMPDFADQVRATVRNYGVRPAMLKLELTESVFVADIDAVIRKMKALSEAGFAIALDDFGTGYSSLSYLRQLPLAQLKIDRSFVRGITDNPRVAAVTRNIVQMGQDLDLEILAEGIETPEQLAMMQAYGCATFQGFLFSRPLPLEAFEGFARQSRQEA
ncbi:EAL domain-containing protein [Bosea sp. TWI1241]|uniref:putative bifunctional diguanylate cyclase/phosphodiesterase n=1 Tax=Bosea sp. TWI1241 TaxID=3148904 RepID=UPI0032090D1F